MLPVNGTREALFAFAQAVVDRPPGPLVVCPNPFYQIYEGAALLAGAEPVFLNQTADNGFGLELDSLSDDSGGARSCCTSARPAIRPAASLTLDEWRALFDYSDRYGFVIASDECYSEIYGDETRRRSAASRRRIGWAATSSGTSWCSPACRSAQTRRACARAASPATPRCCASSCCIARIMGAR